MQSHFGSDALVLQTAEQYDAAIASLTLEQTAAGSTEELLELCMRRNATIPAISCLPDDILAEAFAFVAHDCRHGRVRGWGPFRWITVSHICRHWRIIALDHASLWAHQIQLLPGQDCWKTFVCRAKEAPLVISAPTFDIYQQYGGNQKEPDPAMFYAIQPHAPCFRSLSLDVSAKLLSALAHSPTLDAPILMSLYVRFWCRAQRDTNHDNLWFLSNAPLPSLTDVRLMRAPFPLLCTLFRATLTRLIVIESEVSVMKWIEVLAQMPFLELLHLSESVSLGPEPLSPPSTAVVLPRLRKLVLDERAYEDTGIAYAHLLGWLDIHADCSILLIEVDSHRYHELFSALKLKMTAASNNIRMIPTLKACTVNLGFQSFAIGLWERPEDVVRLQSSVSYDGWGNATAEPEEPESTQWYDCLPNEDTPHFALAMGCTTDDLLEDIARACLRFLPLSDATSLYFLDGTEWLSPSDDPCRHEVLTAFAHITHLHFTHSAPTRLLQHLARPATPDAPGVYPMLPNLRTLTLRLVCGHNHGAHCRRSLQAVTLLEDVAAMLDARREMGLPLASLCFDEVKEEEITVLAEMAAMRKEITWNVAKNPHWHLQCNSTCVEAG